MLWPELRQKAMELLQVPSDIEITTRGIPIQERLFVESHIKMIDNHPRKENMTIAEKEFRINVVQPFYKRLKAYVLLKENF